MQSIAGLLVALLIVQATDSAPTADPIASLASATIQEITKTLEDCGHPAEPYSKGEYDVTCNYGSGIPNLLDVTCRGTRDGGGKKAEREVMATAARDTWLANEKPRIDDMQTYKNTIKNAARNLIYEGMKALCPPTPAGASASKEYTKFYEHEDGMASLLKTGLRTAVLSYSKSGNADKQKVGISLKQWATVPTQADGLAKTMSEQTKAAIQKAKKCDAKDGKTHDVYCTVNGKTPVFLQAVCHGEARSLDAFTSSGAITDAIINSWLSQSQNRPTYLEVSLPLGPLPALMGATLGKLCATPPAKTAQLAEFKVEFATLEKLVDAIKAATPKAVDELKASDDTGKKKLYQLLQQDQQQ